MFGPPSLCYHIKALTHPCILSQPTVAMATEFYPALYTDFDYS